MRFSSLVDIQTQLNNGQLTCKELVQSYLHQIDSHKDLNAYVRVFRDEAFAKAEQIDQCIKNKETLLPLHGMVISVKDVICVKDQLVTGASKILDGFESLYSATAVDRLVENGAIVIGMTNCDEFGMGSANENSHFGAVKNAFNSEYVPGGSSGGAAVSVQIDSCLVALGTDTGGSVRQPASFCGVIGLKPTYGRVSRHGLLAYASSFDQIGFLGKNAKDIELALDIAGGPDEYDATCIDMSFDKLSTSTKRIAYIRETIFSESVDKDVRQAMQTYLDRLKSQGYELVEVDFQLLEYLVPTYYLLTTAEASSNLSRYDGIRYGHRSKDGNTIHELIANSRTEGFGFEVKKRILLGSFVLSAGYYDAYFAKAQKVRRKIQNQLNTILSENDFLLLPTSPSLPWKIGEHKGDPTADYLADIYTVLANLAGLPAISYPIHTTETGFSVGAQLIGAKGTEKALLDQAKKKEEHQ